MTFLTALNLATDEVMNAFWHSVGILASEEALPEADAFAHLRQTVHARIKGAKITHGVDYVPDGRSARWRVRLTIWRGPSDRGDLHADSDFPADLERPGTTLIHGLPAVAEWVWGLIEQAHPGRAIEELSLVAIKHKLRTLRVALSNQHGSCAWRLRYSVAPDATPVVRVPGSLRGLDKQDQEAESFLAFVQVSREEPALRKVST